MSTVLLFWLNFVYILAADPYNFALNAKVTDCFKLNFTHMTDGIVDEASIRPTSSGCQNVSMVVVHLVKKYTVHFVTIHSGKKFDYKYLEQLENLKVDLKSDDLTTFCGSLGSNSVGRSKLQINCDPGYADLVIISGNSKKRFYINEIEVFTLDSGPEKIPMVYSGCFINFIGVPLITNSSVEECYDYCRQKYGKYKIKVNYYLGFTTKSTCACSRRQFTLAKESTMAMCNDKCWEDEFTCGGKGTPVYLFNFKLPVHLGCFEISGIPEYYGVKSVAECMTKCKFYYVGLGDGGKACYCKKRPPNIVIDQQYCDMKCTEHDSHCGGAKVSSVYRNCGERRDISCKDLFHCDDWDESGSCLTPCHTGYIGQWCMERDPEIRYCDIFNTCTNLFECDGNEETFTCICKQGYEEVQNDCKDIDECKEGKDLCNNDSICINVVGSYVCDCNRGYKNAENSTIICEKFAQCLVTPCDSNSTKCIERKEGVFCMCKGGFSKEDALSCKDEDECVTIGCGEHATCINTPGSFKCDCGKGLLTHMSGTIVLCSDIDECLSNVCPHHQKCFNEWRSYRCVEMPNNYNIMDHLQKINPEFTTMGDILKRLQKFDETVLTPEMMAPDLETRISRYESIIVMAIGLVVVVVITLTVFITNAVMNYKNEKRSYSRRNTNTEIENKNGKGNEIATIEDIDERRRMTEEH